MLVLFWFPNLLLTLNFPRLLFLLCKNWSVKSPETSVNQFLLPLRHLWGAGKQFDMYSFHWVSDIVHCSAPMWYFAVTANFQILLRLVFGLLSWMHYLSDTKEMHIIKTVFNSSPTDQNIVILLYCKKGIQKILLNLSVMYKINNPAASTS